MRKISAFAVCDEQPNVLSLATKYSLYHSSDGGKNWTLASTQGLPQKSYITALNYINKTLYLGTAYDGIYRQGNNVFMKCSSGMHRESYSETHGFYDEITSISGSNKGIVAGCAFGGGVYFSDNGGGTWKKINLPAKSECFSNNNNVSIENDTIIASTDDSLYSCSVYNNVCNTIPLPTLIKKFPSGNPRSALVIKNKSTIRVTFSYSEKNKKSQGVANKSGLYAPIPTVRKNPDVFFSYIKKLGLNSIVIDMKDDFGNLYFPTTNSTAITIGSNKKPILIIDILRKLKILKIHSIARIVVFKDEKLYKGYNNIYAIHHAVNGGPWKGTPHEYWVDPHSDFVQNYNISLAVELEKLGFDEIQFDYIRFPSDGPTQYCQYPFKKMKDMYKSEVFMDFLRRIKDSLNIPVSVDIYGFNSWYHFNDTIGQDIEEFSYIVDAISPMVYPSHYGMRFYSSISHSERPYRIVYDGGKRAVEIVNDRVVLRPWLQAFNLLSPTWGPGYIVSQVQGSRLSGCTGFLFWNAKGDYTILNENAVLQKLQ